MNRSTAPTKDYLGISIFNTLCCCLPFGIIAIIYSLRARDAAASGDATKAEQAAHTAKVLNVSGIVIGIVFLIIVIVLQITVLSTTAR
uniref:Uncharacterized protein n=1 Tax=Paramormyrops kingsleyae TaxID=1676925 RepID=A0A3B3RNS6_9TELE